MSKPKIKDRKEYERKIRFLGKMYLRSNLTNNEKDLVKRLEKEIDEFDNYWFKRISKGIID